jgi:hypothetical protein
VLPIGSTRNSAHSRFKGSSRTSCATCLCANVQRLRTTDQPQKHDTVAPNSGELLLGFVAGAQDRFWPTAAVSSPLVARLFCVAKFLFDSLVCAQEYEVGHGKAQCLGILSPMALALLRLTTSSNLVGIGSVSSGAKREE